MKFLFLGLVLFFGAWLIAIMILLGYINIDFINLKNPISMSELGESMGVLDSLFSSIAITLGLIAIIFQARELRSSLENQKEAIKNQTQTIKLQNQTNLISAYTSRINFLLNDNDRIENSIKELKQNTNRKEELFNNLAKKKSKQLNEIKDIDLKIKKILDEIV